MIDCVGGVHLEVVRMRSAQFQHVERNVAQCRLALSAFALVAVFIDPTEPTLTRWIPLTGGAFAISPYTLAVMGMHFGYSFILLGVLAYELVSPERVDGITLWLDVLFGAAIAAVTEGASSPFYAFFAFAVVRAGLLGGFRRVGAVTGLSVGLYLGLILLSAPGNANFYIMRPVYLAIIGYLVGYMGQQRLNLEAGIRELAAASQRQQIARDLHDGRAQALAGIVLRLESCKELLRRGRSTEAFDDLSDLQQSVNEEYDDFRTYMRSLAGLETTSALRRSEPPASFWIAAEFGGSGEFVERVFHILREGVANVERHAGARSAFVRVHRSGSEVQISIDDDGVGFQDAAQRPWSIASRVEEVGGTLCVLQNGQPGAHLAITLPQA
jgi:signal transduction histidine kinase